MTDDELIAAANERRVKRLIKQAKAEAYNECIKKLAKITTLNININSPDFYVIEKEDLDKLLKEMKGGLL